MAFWSYDPINSLGHAPSRYPETFKYPLYPMARYNNGVHPMLSGSKVLEANPYHRGKMEEMLAWCQKSCKARVSFSEGQGSLHFEREEDRAMFRMFFDTMNMPPATHTV